MVSLVVRRIVPHWAGVCGEAHQSLHKGMLVFGDSVFAISCLALVKSPLGRGRLSALACRIEITLLLHLSTGLCALHVGCNTSQIHL